MNKLRILFGLIITLLCFSCESNEEPPSFFEGRTVLVYLVAENNLSAHLYENISNILEGMKSYGEKCQVAIYWDGPDERPVIFKYEIDDEGELSSKRNVRTYNEQNSVSPEVMTKVLKDMMAACPADSYGLVFGSHALSWVPPAVSGYSRSFGDDKKEEVGIPEMAEAISNAILKPLDYMIFDACFMSSVEVMYEMRNVANYIIASPAEILSPGFPYQNIMKYLYSDDVTDYTINVAEGFIDFYKYEYTKKWGTVAVVKCDELENLAAATNNVIKENAQKLDNFNVSGMQRYDRPGFRESYFTFDFDQFIREISSVEEYNDFKTQLDKTVIYEDVIIYPAHALMTINRENYSGIGVYIMQSHKTDLNAYYKTLPWYTASGMNYTSW